VKPCAADVFVSAVSDALAGAPAPAPQQIEQSFDREHLHLVTDMLATKVSELRLANARFSALIDLNVQLASERNPHTLLQKVCAGARELLGSKYAVLAATERHSGHSWVIYTSGTESTGHSIPTPNEDKGILGRAVLERRSVRVSTADASQTASALPASFPAAQAFVAAPVMSLTRTFGWLCLADKVGSEAFTAEDEHILSTLGAQAGRIYENGSLYAELQNHAAQLQVEMDERERAAGRILQLNRVLSMLSGINALIIRVQDRMELFRESCRLAVEQGGFKVAWVGCPELESGDMVSTAWAGPSIEEIQDICVSSEGFSEPESLIASALRLRRPVVCNQLDVQLQSPQVRQQMVLHGFRSMIALPLILENQPLGCLALVSLEADVFDESERRLLNELAGDISFALDHIEKSERLNYLAFYDSLTGLANRTLFQERLKQCVSAAERSGGTVALVIADPERFGTINDSFGRHIGDALLRQVSQRLVECVGSADDVSRLGGDQFAAILLNVPEVKDIERAVQDWSRRWLEVPFQLNGMDLRLVAKYGIAHYPHSGTDAETLIRNAEAALKSAKEIGEKLQFYEPHLSTRASESLVLENQLRRALERREFVLHYQPKVDLETRELVGVEALMRWQSPERGLVGPLKFIPILEQCGMIVEVGAWALQQASVDRSLWMEAGLPGPRVAVNVSTVQLQHGNFAAIITDVVRLAGADPGLDIEVTESLIMGDAAENIERLRAVRALGLGVAIDDFGTGYSSLGYLTRLPVQTLKIDRSFIIAMLDDPGAMTLVSTIISLAHSLRLTVVAEGVESEEQAKILRLLRCDQMQGYLISKPLPFNEMTQFIGRHNPAARQPA
jgi:diguanylate cyclase (GGDEF)-like protein